MVATRTDEAIDWARIREDFPILDIGQRDAGSGWRFSTAPPARRSPQHVIDARRSLLPGNNANIHRGVYELSERATAQYEAARHMVADFINATSAREIIFVRNTTEAINLVAQSWGRRNIEAGDLIVVTTMDHHSNLVPWQMLAEEKGARIEAVRVTDDGRSTWSI